MAGLAERHCIILHGFLVMRHCRKGGVAVNLPGRTTELLAKYILVGITAASPIGEALVAIPLGVGLGLNVVMVVLVSVVCNMAPALVISALFWRAERGTRVVRAMLGLRPGILKAGVVWVLRRRSRNLARALDRWGIWGVLLVTPWAGVYATTLTLETMGMRRARLLMSVAASLAVHGVALALISAGIFRWLWS
jgi:uncharacterized membrane protein